MKVRVHFDFDENLSIEFDLEGADWLTIMRELDSESAKFDKASDEVFGKPNRFGRRKKN